MASDATLPPALLPAVAVALGAAAAWYLPLLPSVGAGVGLALLGVAAGGASGRAVLALGLGLAAAVPARQSAEVPFQDPARIVLAQGTICGHPRRYAEGGASISLCAERLRRGLEVALGSWELRLDLAPGIHAPPLGARVRARGPLARTPGYDNAYRSPAGRWSLRVKAAPFLIEVAEPPAALRWIALLRNRLDRLWTAGGEDRRPAISLARALVLGDAQALPESWQRGLKRTGLAHLIAVSGFNVALVAGAVLLASAPLPRPVGVANSALAATVYLALVGPEPSLVRATGMALAAAAALFCRRSPSSLNALTLVAVGMVIWHPGVLDDVGFRLSVAATAGLLGLAPRIARRLPERPRPLMTALAASLGAQIAATPFAVAAFGRVPLAAPLLNLLFVPASALGLVGGLACGLAGVLSGPSTMSWFLPLLDVAALPFASLPHLPPSILWSLPVPRGLVSGLLLALFFWGLAVSGKFRRAAVLALPLAAAAGHGRPAPEPYELTLLDVGQGDAMLLRAAGAVVLIDGGGARGRDMATSVLLPALARRGITQVDALVLTHADRDHCGGLADLIGWIPIQEIWVPAKLGSNQCTAALTGAGPVRWLVRGQRRQLGPFDVNVLHPDLVPGSTDNAVSLVLDVRAGGRRLLLTGDLDAAGERAIAPAIGRFPRVDLLKVAHHGSSTSSSEQLLRAARPRLALISAGSRNPYGHPTPRTLARLAEQGIPVLRTDRDGEISVSWGLGRSLSIALPGSPRRATNASRR